MLFYSLYAVVAILNPTTLDGRWRLDYEEYHGIRVSDYNWSRLFADSEGVIRGGSLKASMFGLVNAPAQLLLGSSEHHNTFTLLIPKWGLRYHGIYLLVGDTLIICYQADWRLPPPTSFKATDKGDDRVLLKFSRVINQSG